MWWDTKESHLWELRKTIMMDDRSKLTPEDPLGTLSCRVMEQASENIKMREGTRVGQAIAKCVIWTLQRPSLSARWDA